MNQKFETKKRLDIAKKITNSLEGVVKGVLLGGSMGFGQNYSVHDKSDIDMVVVIDKSKINSLLSTWYFKDQISNNVLNLFKKQDINLFWVSRVVDDVEVNAFVYETKGYEDFCLIKASLKGHIKNEPSKTQKSIMFNGEEIEFSRNIKPYDDGFIYEKPTLANDKYYGSVPREDHFYCSHVMIQENNYFDNLEKQVWKNTIKQLIKEHGENPNLEKTSVLKAHYIYNKSPERLPQEIVNKIKERTKKELENYRS